jgi:hypothetical protein
MQLASKFSGDLHSAKRLVSKVEPEAAQTLLAQAAAQCRISKSPSARPARGEASSYAASMCTSRSACDGRDARVRPGVQLRHVPNVARALGVEGRAAGAANAVERRGKRVGLRAARIRRADVVPIALTDVAIAASPHWPPALHYLVAGSHVGRRETAAIAAFTGSVRPLAAQKRRRWCTIRFIMLATSTADAVQISVLYTGWTCRAKLQTAAP